MSDAADTAPRRRNGWIPLLVVAAFVVPILVAYWFAILHPEAAPKRLLNRGSLIEPPIAFDADPAGQALRVLDLQPDEWGLVYFGTGPCAQECLARLELASTIRTLIGAQGKRVHLVALVDEAPASPPALTRVIADAAARGLLSAELAKRGAPAEAGYVFVDARRIAMMAFAPDAPPADIKEDLKRLLRASSVR